MDRLATRKITKYYIRFPLLSGHAIRFAVPSIVAVVFFFIGKSLAVISEKKKGERYMQFSIAFIPRKPVALCMRWIEGKWSKHTNKENYNDGGLFHTKVITCEA